MTKITKRDYFTSLINLGQTGELFFEDADGNRVDVTGEQLVEFAQNEIGQLDRKNEKAKERAEKKRAEGDELTAAVLAVVGNEFESIADIAAKVDGDDVSVAKTQYRLTQLARQGHVTKGTITIPASDGQKARTIVGYKLAE